MLLVVILHVGIMAVRAALRDCQVGDLYSFCASVGGAPHTYSDLDSVVWILTAMLPLGGVLVGFATNVLDDRGYRRYLQFLRLEFDTKLGMHSPR